MTGVSGRAVCVGEDPGVLIQGSVSDEVFKPFFLFTPVELEFSSPFLFLIWK